MFVTATCSRSALEQQRAAPSTRFSRQRVSNFVRACTVKSAYTGLVGSFKYVPYNRKSLKTYSELVPWVLKAVSYSRTFLLSG